MPHDTEPDSPPRAVTLDPSASVCCAPVFINGWVASAGALGGTQKGYCFTQVGRRSRVTPDTRSRTTSP